MIEYPADFPCASREGHAATLSAGLVRSPAGSGDPRQRRSHELLPHLIDLSFIVKQDQYNRWLGWINDHAFDDWVDMPLPGLKASRDDVDVTPTLVRFCSDLQAELMPIHRLWFWQVRVTAEYIPKRGDFHEAPDPPPPPTGFTESFDGDLSAYTVTEGSISHYVITDGALHAPQSSPPPADIRRTFTTVANAKRFSLRCKVDAFVSGANQDDSIAMAIWHDVLTGGVNFSLKREAAYDGARRAWLLMVGAMFPAVQINCGASALLTGEWYRLDMVFNVAPTQSTWALTRESNATIHSSGSFAGCPSVLPTFNMLSIGQDISVGYQSVGGWFDDIKIELS